MIYEYICGNGHAFERVLPVKKFRTPQTCEICGALGDRVLSLPALAYAKRTCEYESPITGKPVTSWAQRRDDMARAGCREYDPEMKTDADRFRREQEAKLDASVDETVEREFEKMPSRKREQLTNELSGGADVNIVRQPGAPT